MGRPLPRKFFEEDNLRIPVLADLGNGNVDAWLIGQEGTGVYWATDGDDTALVTLINGVPSNVGEAQCIVTTPEDEEKNVRQINMNDVKTFDGVTLKWVYEDPITGQGAFKAASTGKDKDEGAEAFNVAIVPEFRRAGSAYASNSNYMQFALTIPPGTYDGMFIIVTRSRSAPDYWPMLPQYNEGGTFYLTTFIGPWDENLELVFRITESSDGSTPTLLLSNTVIAYAVDSLLPDFDLELNLDSQFEGSPTATDQTNPEWNITFTNDGPVVGATFFILAGPAQNDWGNLESQFEVIATETLTTPMITNGFSIASDVALTNGDYRISAYYLNPDNGLSPVNDHDLTVTLP